MLLLISEALFPLLFPHQVTEVWCPMTPQFYREFLRLTSMNAKKALAVMNPVKCWAMDRLLSIHEARGDKIIIFSGEGRYWRGFC